MADAVASFVLWALFGGGEPLGWFRDVDTGRRRPDGDPKREYVEL